MTGNNQLEVFAHTTARNATLYRAVMTAFREAKAQFKLHLRPEEVLLFLRDQGHHFRPVQDEIDELTPLDRDGVELLLTYLVEKNNLCAYQDTVEVSTVAEFLRKRFLYQMTPAGEAAEAALLVFEEQLAQPGELQTTALEDIQLQLRALEELSREAEPDAARAASIFGELMRRFDDLTSQAQRFMGGLQRQIDLFEAEHDIFISYKEMLIDYLDRFIQDLVVMAGTIAEQLQALASHVEATLPLIVDRELRDVLTDRKDEERIKRLTSWRRRWQGLCGWFITRPNQPAQAEILRSRALQAIPDLLSVVAALNERHANRTDRLADLRTLARWFTECDNEDDANRLWRAAFGLHPSRHLMINSDTLAAWDDHPPSPRTSWQDGPRLLISPRLRQYGTTRKRGRIPTIIDRSEERARLAAIARKEAQQLARARAALAASQRILLSQLKQLDPLEFDLFFDLLARALAEKHHTNETVTATAADGTMEVLLEPIPDGPVVEVSATIGTLSVREHHITITDLFPQNIVEEEEWLHG